MIIYKATDKSNGMIYIGQTINTLKERNRLRKYGSSLFDIEFSKKGEEGFKWEIIDTANNINCLNKKEIFWINYYQSTNQEIGYNLVGGGNNSYKTDTVRDKISKAQLGRLNHMYGNKYSLNGASKRVVILETGIVYESASQIVDILFNDISNIDVASAISQCCRGLKKNFKNMTFRFIDDFGNIKYLNGDIEINKTLMMVDGNLDIKKHKKTKYAINIITKEKLDINKLSEINNVSRESIIASLRRNGISIRKYKLPVLKLREVWLHINDYEFFIKNKNKYDFKTNVSKNSYILNLYDGKEFRDADEVVKYYKGLNLKITKVAVLNHLKLGSKFRFDTVKLFKMKYVY